MKYELILWFMWILKLIPGRIGCALRRLALPSRIGSSSLIWDSVQIDYPRKLTVGQRCSINRGAILHCGGGVKIGNNVLIGPNVVVYSQNHVYADPLVPINSQGYVRKSVVLEDDVWIASNAIVLPGVTVRRGSVIGAGSVVTRSTEPMGVYVGNPASLLRRRGEDEAKEHA